ncbi:NAD(P)H-hydrate dehydratase [Oscillospiraceae bacterium CM]|nr:NAD(P)H-hydrate dehydratase [Oscillospiraceae bacterium CM]
MKLCTAAQMREMDHIAIDRLGVPSTLLMTNASRAVAEAAMALLGEAGTAAVFCGSGNNGGDGVAAAVALIKHGCTVRVFLTGNRSKMTPDTVEMVRRLEEAGGVLEDFDDAPDVGVYVARCGVIIDAMFGIGLNTPLRGASLDAVRLINSAAARVVSADIPSGVEADTGRILGVAVRADVTVTFTYPKPGQYIEPGCTVCGDVRVVPIGIPDELVQALETDCHTVANGDISLPRRRPDTHKGDYGRDLIIAGSVGFTGAPVLAARAASAMGAGLVFLGVPEDVYTIAAVKCVEEMVFPLPAQNGQLATSAEGPILDRLKSCDVCLLGPGLGRSEAISELVTAVIRRSAVPLVLDADGINALSANIDVLDEARCPVILTPHDGEYLRLGGDLSDGDRLTSARSFATDHNCILVLKGHRTIIALPDGTAYINTTGGPSMAKGGSGDVLSGMIAALIGQKFPLKDAVLAAVFLHGQSGDRCAARFGEYAVTASDLIGMLPDVTKAVTTNE